MLFKYILTYLIVDWFCLFFAIFIFRKITIDMGTEREVQAMRSLIIVFCVFLFADAIWNLGVNGALPLSPAAVGIVEHFAILLMCGLAYFWFLFAENRIRAPFMEYRRANAIAAIPLVVVIALYATTGFTGLIFQIGSDASFAAGPASLVPSLVFVLYMGFTAAHSLVRYFGETSRALKRNYLTLAAFVFAPVACGILDMVVHGMPVMAISVIAALLLVFMTFQSARINTDALTGLNNRRRAEEYIDDQVSSLSDDTRFGVFLVDVDYFKEINDAYGHIEGDRTLVVIANGLRETIGNHHGLAARWGGDEFVIATFLAGDEMPEGVEAAIRTRVDAARTQEQLAYPISLSIGYALAHRDEPLSEIMAEADRSLYRQKDAHHKAAAQPESAK